MAATIRAVADEIASAAELVLGKTARRPAALVRGASPPLGEGSIARRPHARRVRPVPLTHRGRTAGPARASVRPARPGPTGRATRPRPEEHRPVKIGLQVNRFDWPGGTAAIGPTLARIVRDGRRGRVRLDLGDGPLLPDPRPRAGRGPDARGLDDPRLHGRPLDAGAPGADGRRRPLPAARPVGEGRDDARRPVRRPGLARHRGGLERGGERRPRLPDAAARRPASRCSRRRSGSPTRCGRASAARRRPSTGATTPASRLLNAPQSISRPRVADHDRRRRRAEDAPPRRPVRATPRTSSAAPRGSPTSTPSCASTARRSGRPYEEIERSTLQSTRLSVGGRAGTETPEAAATRFAALADAGAQHVIVVIGNIEQPGVDALAARLAELVHAIPTT